MKSLFKVSFFALILVASSLFAQAQEMVTDSKIMIEEVDNTKQSLNKATVPAWYDFISDASSFGVSWTRITNATLFPDTLVYQLYGASGGGVQLGRTGTHSIGQIFDPKDEYVFTGSSRYISRFNPYLLDTIAFRYRYAHNLPGTTDTLVVQFYNTDKIQRTTLSGSGRKTATLAYDKVGNKGASPTSEMRIELTEADTSNWADNTDYAIIQIPVPNGGISVPEGGLCAVTLSFIPGYSYEEGDTIQHDWETPPTKVLNHFLAPRWSDNDKLLASFDGYNTGLRANTSSRYTTLVWNERYIPGHAWNAYDENYYFFFHIVAEKVSVPSLGEKVSIYPNPSIHTPTVIEGHFINTKLEVINVQGTMVKEIQNLTDYTELQLPQGTYFLHFLSENESYVHKLIKY